MTKEEKRKVELTLMEFIDRATNIDAPRVEVEVLPGVVMALVEISKVEPSGQPTTSPSLADSLKDMKIYTH